MGIDRKRLIIILLAVVVGLPCFAGENKDPNRPILGIKYSGVTREIYGKLLKNGLRLPRRYGVWVSFIGENSPAEVAGFQKNDLIYKINNKNIVTSEGLTAALLKNGTEQFAVVDVFSPVEKGKKLIWKRLQIKVKPMKYKDYQAMIEALFPLKDIEIRMSEDSIGTPYVNIRFFNRTFKKIVGFKVVARTWNNFNEPLPDFNGIAQGDMLAQKKNAYDFKFYNNDTATKGELAIIHIKYEDGTEWKPGADAIVYYPFKMH
jgi:membrane-associated protease RseP (regulator of RpoE activity)